MLESTTSNTTIPGMCDGAMHLSVVGEYTLADTARPPNTHLTPNEGKLLPITSTFYPPVVKPMVGCKSVTVMLAAAMTETPWPTVLPSTDRCIMRSPGNISGVVHFPAVPLTS